MKSTRWDLSYSDIQCTYTNNTFWPVSKVSKCLLVYNAKAPGIKCGSWWIEHNEIGILRWSADKGTLRGYC